MSTAHPVIRPFVLLLLLLTAPVLPASEESTQMLAGYGADLHKTSVSGLSSGAFMTSQLYLAHSDIMVGAGIVAGGPYLCALSWESFFIPPLTTATTSCMDPFFSLWGPNVSYLVSKTEALAEAGKIDALSNLADDRIYLFSGRKDHTVNTTVVDDTYDFFQAIGISADAMRYNSSVDAGHAIITADQQDVPCADTSAPYINDCGFSQAERIIRQIYPAARPPATTLSSQVIPFDQREFLSGDHTSMATAGYVYVPQYCREHEGCAVHVAIHGCQQSVHSLEQAGFRGDLYYATTGYNEMADANQLIVLYPQVDISSGSPFNPQGCWDFWGYSATSDNDFYSRDAPQIKALYAMIERLAEVPAQPSVSAAEDGE